MKKTLIAICLTTISFSALMAKDISEKRNLVGINGGVTLNTMGLDKNSTYSNSKNSVKIGGNAGINFEHRLKKVFAIELGVNYMNKGTQQKIQDPALNKSYIKLNFHSVEVPLIFKFYMGKNKVFNVNVGGFASYAFNVQKRTKIDFKNSGLDDINEKENNLLSKDNNIIDVDGQRALRPYDAGVNVGFEFVSKMGIGAGARVQQGLVDFTNPKFIVDDEKKVYHTSALFYALFKF